MAECKQCGGLFEHDRGNRIYCSRRCRRAANQPDAKAKKERDKERYRIKQAENEKRQFSCVRCGGLFAGRKAKYCSEGCRTDARRERQRNAKPRKFFPKRTKCLCCGAVFMPTVWQNTKYCSLECKRNALNHYRAAKKRGVRAEIVDPFAVFKRDSWRCHLCRRRVLKSKRGSAHPLAPELDHIVPLSVGGAHAWSNVACSCRECNRRKGARELGQLRLCG